MKHAICRPTPTSNHHSDDNARGLSGVVAHVCACLAQIFALQLLARERASYIVERAYSAEIASSIALTRSVTTTNTAVRSFSN